VPLLSPTALPLLNPVLLNEQSTQKLPRALLLCMLVAYALSGLLGRDPWRGDDAVGFGMALSIALGHGAEQLQAVAGAGLAANGPLWFAVVGGFIRALWFLPAHIAAVVPVALATLLAAYALWYTVYYLAKTPAAQPLAHALGGQPDPIAYARAVADGAVLLLLATLGIALRTHEISAHHIQFVLLCCLTLGVCLWVYKPRWGLLVLCATLLALGAAVGLQSVVTAMVWLALLSTQQQWRGLRLGLLLCGVSAACGIAAPLCLATSLGQHAYATQLWAWHWELFGLISGNRLAWLLSNGAIFAWPAIPFAFAALWRWRRYWRAPHIWAGGSYVGVFVASMVLSTRVGEGALLAVLPGALILAAFLLPALPRAWMNAIDWFGVMTLSMGCVFFWLVWIAMTFGWPPAFAKNVLRLVPGLDTTVNGLTLGIGLLATVFWLFVVRWRVLSAKNVVWRAAVVWSAGSLCLWVIVGSLFMPWANHYYTYRNVAVQLKTALKDHSQCVSPVQLGLPQRAVIAYFGEIRFEPQPLQTATDAAAENAPIDTPVNVACNWLLEYATVQPEAAKESRQYLPTGNWQLRWEGRRFRDKTERFRLYQRTKGGATKP
jgi:4-amino-4-deoxy-L-arabinose transferase-like glycosyltransferase